MAAAEEILQDRAVWPRSYEDESYRNGFLRTVGDLQKAGVLQDVVLEVEGRRFPCHRLVLSAASPYFRAMFTNNMVESRQNTVVLQGLDPDTLEEILSYIYSGTLHVSLDKVQPLYQAADLLQVEYVRETCTSYMAMNVEQSTCLDLYKFADAFSVRVVQKHSLQCICKHFEQVSTTAEFCSLSVDQLTDIISQDWLDVKEETTVWEAVVRWVEHSREDRQDHLPSILPHIRFNLMTSEETAAILEHPLVREVLGSSEVIRSVVQRGTSNLQLRFGMDTLEMALVLNTQSRDIEMCYMNPRVGRYMYCSFSEDVYDLKFIITVTSENDIYILALTEDWEESVPHWSLLKYNHLENVWEQKTSVCSSVEDKMPDSHYLVEVDGYLYYLAVWHVGEHDMSVWLRKYIHHTDQWQECSQPQLEARSGRSAAVSCSQHIYLITNLAMHRYHPSTDQWCRMTRASRPPVIVIAVAVGNEIFCQTKMHAELFVYNTESDSWRELPTSEHPIRASYRDLHYTSSTVFVLGGQLHTLIARCARGVSGDGPEEYQVCVYDRAAGVWTDLEVSMPSEYYIDFGAVCPVARMYLPCLNASGTDVQSTASQ